MILKETLQPFKGRKIITVTGNAKLDRSRLAHQKIIDFKSWGKTFLDLFQRIYCQDTFPFVQILPAIIQSGTELALSEINGMVIVGESF